MNTKANKYILNEIDVYLINLYKLFMDKNSEDIISHIENRIEEFELPKERTKRNVYQGDLNNIENEQNYSRCKVGFVHFFTHKCIKIKKSNENNCTTITKMLANYKLGLTQCKKKCKI